MDAWTWPHPPGPPGEVVWLAAVLLAGALMGEAIARTTRWPRVLGYTLAGAGAAAAGLHLSLPLPDTARWVIDLALALLLFEIGTRVRLRWLRHNPGLLATSLLEATGTAAAASTSAPALDTASAPTACHQPGSPSASSTSFSTMKASTA